MIEPLKEGYLDGVGRITFVNKSIGTYKNSAGVHYPNNHTIVIKLYGKEINDIRHLSTLCHELLHLHGLRHSKVMRQLDKAMVCYDFDKLNEQQKVYDMKNDGSGFYPSGRIISVTKYAHRLCPISL